MNKILFLLICAKSPLLTQDGKIKRPILNLIGYYYKNNNILLLLIYLKSLLYLKIGKVKHLLCIE